MKLRQMSQKQSSAISCSSCIALRVDLQMVSFQVNERLRLVGEQVDRLLHLF